MQAVLRIPGYDSFEQIAVGGMAVVYKARKQSLKKTVAIKVLLPHLAADARFVERFQQEAEAAAKIQHDNIVNVIDCGRYESSYYIVMEFYDGVTVEELLQAHATIPVDIALTIVLNVCYGLEAAHAENLVHRDIKPANVIFTRQGGIKLADFGLAKAMDKLTLVTHTGKVVGTPAYMSPEQTRGEPVRAPSDIFSLGVVTYELLAGRRPFDGSSYSEVVDAIQSFNPSAASAYNPLIETSVDALVARMLAKHLSERYERVSDVARELERVMDRLALRRDRRALGEFFANPKQYADVANRALYERISGGAARAAAAGKAAPSEQGGYRDAAGVPRIRTEAPRLDPKAEYKVVLTAIDRSVETPDTFALKLAMRLKSPVPRMRSLVSRMPCTVAQRLPYKKAKWLLSVLKELGGTAGMEEVVETEEPSVAQDATAPAARGAESAKSLSERRTSTGGIICPRCGWEEEADARFCSLCLQRFNKTDKIDMSTLQSGFVDPGENPLAGAGEEPRPAIAHLKRLPSLPPRLYYVIGAAITVLAVVLAVVLR